MTSSELQQLVSAGIISAEQSVSITQFQSSQKSSGGFSHSIVTIGSILIGLGVLSLVAFNRDGMSDLLKIFIVVGSMTISYLLGRHFKNQQKSLLGGSLLFLSGLLCGCSIFLVAQIYNLTWTNDVLLGIWILMILPLVYLLRQKEFYYLYMILLSCVLGQFLMSHVFQTVDERTTVVLYSLFGLLLLFVGLCHDDTNTDVLLAKLYKIFGSHISIIAYAIFIMMSDSFLEGSGPGLGGFSFSTPLVWFLIGVGLLYLIGYAWKRKIDFLCGFTVFFVMQFGIEMADIALLNYIIFIALCIFAIYFGYQRNNNGLIKSGNVYLYLFLLYLYGKYGWEYENKALFFIIGGVLMIGLGLGFSKLNTIVSQKLTKS